MTPRNYFFPIAPSVQLTKDLSGALVYVDNQLGAKSTNDPITGIFLFRTTHSAPIDPSDDAYMVEEYTLYNTWWQADLPFDAPFETKLKTYRDTGALWLDNSMLSEYLLLYVLHPDTWHRWHYHEHIDSYFDNHSGRKILALTQAYQAYSVCSNPCTHRLVSYLVDTFPKGLYHSMLAQMKMRIEHLYERELQPLYGHITERMLSYGIALLERRHNTWYECMAEPELYGSSFDSKQTPWTKYSIHQVILAYMLASYWMQHADIERQELFPEELAEVQISVTLRKELWEVYYRLHRVRLFDQLNLEDSRSEQPIDAEIKLALAKEEQSRTSMPDLSPWSHIPQAVETLSTRITTYISQFLQFLGYTPSTTPLPKSESPISNHQSTIVWSPTLRSQLLHAIYTQLMQDTEHPFTGKSQWFYIYKMLTEQQIFSEDEYAPFVQVLKAAKVPDNLLPNTTTFSVKKKSITSSSAFPHWELRTNKRADILRIGTHHARIAFEVLGNFTVPLAQVQ